MNSRQTLCCLAVFLVTAPALLQAQLGSEDPSINGTHAQLGPDDPSKNGTHAQLGPEDPSINGTSESDILPPPTRLSLNPVADCCEIMDEDNEWNCEQMAQRGIFNSTTAAAGAEDVPSMFLFVCLAKNQDTTTCCKEKGVVEECLPICNASNPPSEDQMKTLKSKCADTLIVAVDSCQLPTKKDGMRSIDAFTKIIRSRGAKVLPLKKVPKEKIFRTYTSIEAAVGDKVLDMDPYRFVPAESMAEIKREFICLKDIEIVKNVKREYVYCFVVPGVASKSSKP